VIEPHRPRRRNLLAETRLTSEWVAKEYPGRNWHFQFRVGQDPQLVGINPNDEGEVAWARNFNRRVDAVIEPPPELVMIEAKMWDPTTAIGRLQEYELLLAATPEVAEWGPGHIVPVLLTAQHDPLAEVICRRHAIRYVFWAPPWIDEFYAMYPERRRKAAFAGMVDELTKRSRHDFSARA
jgi:hypothetical protein